MRRRFVFQSSLQYYSIRCLIEEISDINGGLFSLMQINQAFALDSRICIGKSLVIVAAIAAVLVGATAMATADSTFADKKREYSQGKDQC